MEKQKRIMKVTVNINGIDTEIELTSDQVAKVKKQSTKVTDRIKTFQDACEELGIDSNELHLHDDYGVSAFIKLQIIVKALNEGWIPDWKNSSQYKYYPYFKTSESGAGFSLVYFDSWITGTFVGSRLCYKNSELAMYAGEQFSDLYNQFLSL